MCCNSRYSRGAGAAGVPGSHEPVLQRPKVLYECRRGAQVHRLCGQCCAVGCFAVVPIFLSLGVTASVEGVVPEVDYYGYINVVDVAEPLRDALCIVAPEVVL